MRVLFLVALVLTSSLSFSDSLDERLIKASADGKTSEIKQLIMLGAKVNFVSGTGSTALWEATNFNHADSVDVLLKNGADIKVSGNRDPVLCTAVGRDTVIVGLLLDAGANPNVETSQFRYSPLGLAAGQTIDTFIRLTKSGSYAGPMPNTLATIKLLLKAGANINHVDSFQESPLRAAIRVHNTDIAHLLLEAGSDTQQATDNIRGNQAGNTILMEAIGWYALFKDESVVKMLLSYNADPDYRNEEVFSRECELRGGCDWRGYTALTYSAKQGYLNIVQALLENGANPKLPRTDGQFAEDIANNYGHPKTAALIKQYGAKIPNKQRQPTR